MTLSRGSLSGQNRVGRDTGANSNFAPSAIFKKLRKLDRQITELDNIIRLRSFGYIYFEHNILVQERVITDIIGISKSEWQKLIDRRIKLDQRRKTVRFERKYAKLPKTNS